MNRVFKYPAVLILIITSFIIFFIFGRLLGLLYYQLVIPILPNITQGIIINWLIWGTVSILVIFPIENINIWSKIYNANLVNSPDRYNVAPIGTGFIIGFLSPWIYI